MVEHMRRVLRVVSLSMVATGCGDDGASSPADTGSSTGVDSGETFDVNTTTGVGPTSISVGEAASVSDSAEVTTDPTSPTTTTPVTTDSTGSPTSSSTTDPSGDPTTGGSSGTDGGSSSESGSSGEASTTGGGEFPPAPPFGSTILDYDLVGSWNLNWDPASGFDSVFTVDESGDFTWVETSADCSTSTSATGYVWVEGTQVVLHVETWDRQLPWDTEPVLGETFPPPFRLRMSFTLQGSAPNAYLAFAAPSRIVEAAPYEGASYVRLSQEGDYLGGDWRGEAELQAIPAGATEPVVIVRDVRRALLDAEADPSEQFGEGIRVFTTTYYPTPYQTETYPFGNWTCLGECGPSGTAYIDGATLYTYGFYAAQQQLMSFSSGRAFRRDIPSDCP